MAGAKESPRQQMINLMYLVLTALLALQVSSSIIDKFFFLAKALDESAVRAQKSTDLAVDAFQKQAEKDGQHKEPEHLKKVKAIEEIRKLAKDNIEYLEKIEKDIVEKAGGGIDPETKKPKDVQGETKVETLMIGPAGSKSGEGYKMQQKMNAYAGSVAKLVQGVDPKFKDYNLEDLCKDKDGVTDIDKNKDYVNRTFGQTPVAASIAVLAHLKNEVRRYESEAVRKVGVNEVPPSPDVYQAAFSLESRVVASGQKIKGKMFLFATSEKIPMDATLNGSPVNKNSSGVAEFEVAAAGAGKRALSGEIKTKIKGKDTTFVFKEEVDVVQPEITVISSSVNALYEECGNALTVICPSLGASYNPSFNASGAATIRGSKPEEVVLVPSTGTKNVKLSVSSGGQPLGSRDFTVRKVPAVKIEIRSGDRTVDPVQGVNPRANLRIVPVPDPSFAEFLPKDANYRVESAKVTLRRSGRPAGSQNVSGSDLSLQSLKAQPGDVVIVEINAVKRGTFRGTSVNADVSGKVHVVPLNN